MQILGKELLRVGDVEADVGREGGKEVAGGDGGDGEGAAGGAVLRAEF